MKAKEVNDRTDVKRLRFDCPGCGETHIVTVSGPNAWGFNWDFEKPTLTPSVLVQTHRPGPIDWSEGMYAPAVLHVCHSYVTDGKIQFLSDCTHELANQTVDLLDIDPGTEVLIPEWMLK